MRYKPVPTPGSLSVLASIQSAVPLVPGSTDDCCARIVARTTVESRDVARRWLTFLQALTLVKQTESGYVRTDVSPTDDQVRAAFREQVYAAEEVLTTVEECTEPVTAADIGADLDVMPVWERAQATDASAAWTDRVESLLEWGAIFGYLTDTEDGYVPVDRG